MQRTSTYLRPIQDSFKERPIDEAWVIKPQASTVIFQSITLNLTKQIWSLSTKLSAVTLIIVHLVVHSSAKAKKWYVINLPRNIWWVYLLMRMDYYWQKLTTGKAFLTYFHPIGKIEALLVQTGFKKVQTRKQREWIAILFERDLQLN